MKITPTTNSSHSEQANSQIREPVTDSGTRPSDLKIDQNKAVNCDQMVVILSDHFKIVSEASFGNKSRLKKCSLSLTDTYLSWCLESKVTVTNDSENLVSLSIPEIIGCRVTKSDKSNGSIPSSAAILNIFSYPFRSQSYIYSKPSRVRKVVTLVIDHHQSWKENFEIADQWSRAIKWLIKDKSLVKPAGRICDVIIPAGNPAKRNLLILINPASGPGKAAAIFAEKVSPLLAEADIHFTVQCTTKSGSASEYIATMCNILDWDGIVIVSGDGLVFELFNGLMARKDVSTAIKIPVGVIPGGSGNGLAHSINYAVGEFTTSNPILAATLNIVRGKVTPMDLVKVEMKSRTIYSFLSVGWGLLSDIDIESERLRMMGGFRFTVWTLIRLFALRKYRGTLSYLPVAGYDQLKNPFNGNVTHNVPNNHSNGQVANGHLDQKCIPFEMPGLDDPVPSSWTSVKGEFIMFYTGHQSHLSGDCFFAPSARLDDGIIWLLYITADVSRSQLLTFMTSLESGKHVDLPYITMLPVQAFRLEPWDEKEGRVTIDGELVPTGTIQASVLPGVARIMSR